MTDTPQPNLPQLREKIGSVLRNWDKNGANDFTEDLGIDAILAIVTAEIGAALDKVESDVIDKTQEIWLTESDVVFGGSGEDVAKHWHYLRGKQYIALDELRNHFGIGEDDNGL